MPRTPRCTITLGLQPRTIVHRVVLGTSGYSFDYSPNNHEITVYYYPTYYIKCDEVLFAISLIAFHCACHRTIDRWIVLDMDRYYTMAWYLALLNQENSTVHAVFGTISSELTLINGNNASEWQWSPAQCLNDTDQIETSEWCSSGYSVQCRSRVYFSKLIIWSGKKSIKQFKASEW